MKAGGIMGGVDGWFLLNDLFLFSAISAGVSLPAPCSEVWKIKAPQIVIAFGRLALLGCILTLDNLRKRRQIMANGCLMCFHNAELVDHSLVSWPLARSMWLSVLVWFNCSWAMPDSLSSFFVAWRWLGVGGTRGRVMRKSAFLTVIWVIWKERNRRCLERVCSSEADLVSSIKFLVASWVSILPQCIGFSMDSILTWEAGTKLLFLLLLGLYRFPLGHPLLWAFLSSTWIGVFGQLRSFWHWRSS